MGYQVGTPPCNRHPQATSTATPSGRNAKSCAKWSRTSSGSTAGWTLAGRHAIWPPKIRRPEVVR